MLSSNRKGKPIRLTISMSLLAVALITACSPQTVQFQLTETKVSEESRTTKVEINNCNGALPSYKLYFLPGGIGGGNLTPNGGEPFVSIRKALVDKYGKSLRWILLSAPGKTRRVFTVTILLTTYEGEVIGTIIDTNKIDLQQPATYRYPRVTDATTEASEDIPCDSAHR